jgi:hypothetical protein
MNDCYFGHPRLAPSAHTAHGATIQKAVKAFEGHRSTAEMLDAFRYEVTRNA